MPRSKPTRVARQSKSDPFRRRGEPILLNEQDEIRRHIKIFVNREQVRNLAVPLRAADEVMIVCALSGG